MNKQLGISVLSAVMLSMPVLADDLTLNIEQELERLGYITDLIDGEESIETMIAIAKYQAEHNFEITGTTSENLLQTLSATTQLGEAPSNSGLAKAVIDTVVNPEGLNAAREACFKGKMLLAQASESDEGLLNDERKDQLVGQATQIVMQAANIGMLQQVYNVYSNWESESASDSPEQSEIASIASGLGITADDVTACQRPIR